jgi:hypothetical protein
LCLQASLQRNNDDDDDDDDDDDAHAGACHHSAPQQQYILRQLFQHAMTVHRSSSSTSCDSAPQQQYILWHCTSAAVQYSLWQLLSLPALVRDGGSDGPGHPTTIPGIIPGVVPVARPAAAADQVSPLVPTSQRNPWLSQALLNAEQRFARALRQVPLLLTGGHLGPRPPQFQHLTNLNTKFNTGCQTHISTQSTHCVFMGP